MTAPRILVLAGSLRNGSFNGRLADAAARSIDAQGGSATRIDLGDHPMPFVDAGYEPGDIPEPVHTLHAMFGQHDGVFIATPEYNAFPSPLLFNALDWLSRVRHYEGGMVEVFERPLFAISAASPSPIGGYRALMALRQKLELGLGATVVPAMAWIAAAYQAFDEAGNLAADNDQAMLDRTLGQLLTRLGA